MNWTVKDKAEALLITDRHVSRLTAMGILPKSGEPKQITAAYIRHLKTERGDKENLLEERTRLTRIQADRKELELRIAQGELIDTAEAMRRWGAVVQSIRSKLLAMPSKLGPLVFGAKTLSEINEVSEKFVHEVLSELANPNLKKHQYRDSRNLRDSQTAVKTHGVRVGGQKARVIRRK